MMGIMPTGEAAPIHVGAAYRNARTGEVFVVRDLAPVTLASWTSGERRVVRARALTRRYRLLSRDKKAA